MALSFLPEQFSQVNSFYADKLPMMRRIVTPLFLLLCFIPLLGVQGAHAMELSDLPQFPDEKKIERKPAVISLDENLSEEEIANSLLKKDVNQNLKNLDSTTKALQGMGIVKPDCADCESLTNKKTKGRSPAVEIQP